jgi:PPM family protein phosphatase
MSDAAEPLPLDPPKLAVATLSDPGRVRPENQDAVAVLANVSNERMVAVVDGMGGNNGGETAAKVCLETLARVFREPHGKPEERLRRGLELANEEVYAHALSKPDLKGMGTTAVALVFGAGTSGVWLAWIGDSRCYQLRDGNLTVLTRDHSLMAEWVKMGVLQADEVESHPRRHELTRVVGLSPDVQVELVRVDVRVGDRFLLCSDGVHSLVPERLLKAGLSGPHSPEEAARQLVDRANANGGSDNATVAVVEIVAEAVREGVEQPPEVPLELELPKAPALPEPAPTERVFELADGDDTEPLEIPAAAEPAPAAPPDDLGIEIEPTAHSSAAIDAALAELAAARTETAAAAPEPAQKPSSEDSMFGLSMKFDMETPSAEPETPPAETSFADLMGDEPPASAPEPAPPAQLGRPLTPPRSAPVPEPDFSSPGLVAPPPSRAVRIPLMTPVRKRRGLHAASLLTGVAAGAAVVGIGIAGWLYVQSRPVAGSAQTAAAVPRPQPSHTSPPPAVRVTPPPPPPQVTPPPEPAPAPAPEPEPSPAAPEPTAERPAEPPPAPAPTSAVTPQPHPAPAQVPAAPAPIEVPAPPAPQPTTVVIVRPANPQPPATIPAAPDGTPMPQPLPTSTSFELPPPVHRFVDDWLRAQETHDSQLFSSLGFPTLPGELAGTWSTRNAYRLVAASIDEERSTPDVVYLRVVLSYAFTDSTGRFRTQDEERMILHTSGNKLRFEGRWSQ